MELMSMSELAEHFKLDRRVVHMWISRRSYNGFPEHVTVGRGSRRRATKLYDVAEVVAWRASYQPQSGRSKDAPRDSRGRYVVSK